MKNRMKYLGAALGALWLLGSCSTTARIAGSGAAFDDLYATHDRQAYREAEVRQAEALKQLREQRALKDIEAAGQDGYYSENILSDSYEESYERRLRGFSSLSYKLPGSYYDLMYSDKAFEAAAYDPAFYNVILMGDQVWVEPRYITSMFGNWGTSVNLNIGWGWNRWYRPYWDWAWGMNSWYFGPSYAWGYPGYWGSSWGWGYDPYWGWNGHYDWGYPGYWGGGYWGGGYWGGGYWGGSHGGGGRYDGRDVVTSPGRRPSSTVSSAGSGYRVPSTGSVGTGGSSNRRGASTTRPAGVYYNNGGTTTSSSGTTYRRGTVTTSPGSSSGISSGSSSGRRGSTSSSSGSYNSGSRNSGNSGYSAPSSGSSSRRSSESSYSPSSSSSGGGSSSRSSGGGGGYSGGGGGSSSSGGSSGRR